MFTDKQRLQRFSSSIPSPNKAHDSPQLTKKLALGRCQCVHVKTRPMLHITSGLIRAIQLKENKPREAEEKSFQEQHQHQDPSSSLPNPSNPYPPQSSQDVHTSSNSYSPPPLPRLPTPRRYRSHGCPRSALPTAPPHPLYPRRITGPRPHTKLATNRSRKRV
jgi:cytoskeletal protein RodZ